MCGTGNIGGIQYGRRPETGRALSPLLFIAVVEVISRKAITRDNLRKLLYVDNCAVVADSETDLQERLVEWKEIFGRHGLRVKLEKTEVLWTGHQKKRSRWEKLNQQDIFVYLGGAVCGDGGTETYIRRRIQAGVRSWRKVEGVMEDIHIFRKVKGKLLSSYITPAYQYGLQTMAMTENKRNCKFTRVTG